MKEFSKWREKMIILKLFRRTGRKKGHRAVSLSEIRFLTG